MIKIFLRKKKTKNFLNLIKSNIKNNNIFIHKKDIIKHFKKANYINAKLKLGNNIIKTIIKETKFNIINKKIIKLVFELKNNKNIINIPVIYKNFHKSKAYKINKYKIKYIIYNIKAIFNTIYPKTIIINLKNIINKPIKIYNIMDQFNIKKLIYPNQNQKLFKLKKNN